MRGLIFSLICLGFLLNCATPRAALSPTQLPPTQPPPKEAESLEESVRSLGEGLRFMNIIPPEGAQSPEVGADYMYARTFSANSRNSPVGIELWAFDEQGKAIHPRHKDYLRQIYKEIYGWDPEAWKKALSKSEDAALILQTKSDFFWESLGQQLAERVFGEAITPSLYLFGPQCLESQAPSCRDEGIHEIHTLVVRTFLDARRDPMNPVTRSITYRVRRGEVANAELIFELQVPNGIKVAGPYQETIDFRPRILGNQESLCKISLWAHLPSKRRARTKNFDYPDYNLLFVPLRHLVIQGEVENPKAPASSKDYESQEALIEEMRLLFRELRTPAGAKKIASKLKPFLSPKYYYMFEDGGQGVESYSSYILGEGAGIARGLNPDFGLIELMVDGIKLASFREAEAKP